MASSSAYQKCVRLGEGGQEESVDLERWALAGLESAGQPLGVQAPGRAFAILFIEVQLLLAIAGIPLISSEMARV